MGPSKGHDMNMGTKRESVMKLSKNEQRRKGKESEPGPESAMEMQSGEAWYFQRGLWPWRGMLKCAWRRMRKEKGRGAEAVLESMSGAGKKGERGQEEINERQLRTLQQFVCLSQLVDSETWLLVQLIRFLSSSLS